MTTFPDPVTRFTGVDGAHHRIGFLDINASFHGGRGIRKMLADEWEGHGLRELCLLSPRDDSAPQVEAVIREYRVDAATTDRPLSRLVDPAELAQREVIAAALSVPS